LAPGHPGWREIRSRSSTEGAVHALSTLVGEGEQEGVQPGSGEEGEVPRRHPCREDVGRGLPDAVGCLSHRERLRSGGPIRPPFGLGPQHHGCRDGHPARRGDRPCARLPPVGVVGRSPGSARRRRAAQGLHQGRALPPDAPGSRWPASRIRASRARVHRVKGPTVAASARRWVVTGRMPHYSTVSSRHAGWAHSRGKVGSSRA
jgi:hypothetical protein